MKIGILSLNFSWHGEATAAATRCLNLRQQGHDAELFTFSKSGKILKRMRTDFEYTVLKSNDVKTCVQFLDSKDIIISFGTGVPGEDEFDDTPKYIEALSKCSTPIIAYMPITSDLLFKAYPHSAEFLKMKNVVGTMFPRQALKDFCYTNAEYVEYYTHLPFLVSKRPIDISKAVTGPKTALPKPQFVCSTRIAPSKKTHLVLRAIRDHNLLDIADFEIWGDLGESRYGYRLTEEFGDLFHKLYKGPYTHRTIERVYEDKRFFFDLTNFEGDGGDVQNTFLEGVMHGAVPIVPPGWDVAQSCIQLSELTPDGVAKAVALGVVMPEVSRLQLLARAQLHIAAHHNPEKIANEVVDYCCNLSKAYFSNPDMHDLLKARQERPDGLAVYSPQVEGYTPRI